VLGSDRQRSQNEQVQRPLRKIDMLVRHPLPFGFYKSSTFFVVEAQGVSELDTGPKKLHQLWCKGLAFVAVALAGGALFLRNRKAHAMSETDTVVLADFANSIGDAIFDDTLKQALAVSLRQSPFLNGMGMR
jgi:hypothetical protein